MSTTVSAVESARAELSTFGERLIGPDDARYEEARALFNAMIDKRPALIARCETADDVRPRSASPATTTCASPSAAARTTARPCERRRRARHRPVADEVHRGRPGRADRPRRRRLGLGRGRRGDPAAQPCRPDGDHLLDGRRRPDPGRRARVPRAPSRADGRQPARRGDGARRRLAGDREREREPGPVLGDPRRRRQLRRRHRVHVPRAPARHDRRRADVLADRADATSCSAYREFLPAAPRDVMGFFELPHDPAGADLPGGAPPAQGVRHRLVHRRLGRGRGGGDGADTVGRRAAAPRRRADADRGAQRRVRRPLRPGRPVVLAGRLRRARSPTRRSCCTASADERMPGFQSGMHLYPIDGAVQDVGRGHRLGIPRRDLVAGLRRRRPGAGQAPTRSASGPSATRRRSGRTRPAAATSTS